jgi:hypothetical protein
MTPTSLYKVLLLRDASYDFKMNEDLADFALPQLAVECPTTAINELHIFYSGIS